MASEKIQEMWLRYERQFSPSERNKLGPLFKLIRTTFFVGADSIIMATASRLGGEEDDLHLLVAQLVAWHLEVVRMMDKSPVHSEDAPSHDA